jgi:hypothetical protein
MNQPKPLRLLAAATTAHNRPITNQQKINKTIYVPPLSISPGWSYTDEFRMIDTNNSWQKPD